MDGNNPRPAAPGGEARVARVDWRTQLQTNFRERIVNKIIETLKIHLPLSGPEGLQEHEKIAVRFEEQIYSTASSQPDYLRKISLKMLNMTNKSRNTIQNTGPVNPGSNSLPDTGASHSVPLHFQNPSQAHQQLVSQNVQNNTAPGGVQISTGLNTSLPSVSGIPQSPMTNVVGLDGNMQNFWSISQASAGNEMGQTVHSRVISGSQRHMENVVLPQQQYFGQVQNQPQAYQQLVSQNVQNNMAPGGVRSWTGRNTSLPSVSGITPSPITNVVGLDGNMQNVWSISQASAGNEMGQIVRSRVFSGPQRHIENVALPQQQYFGQVQNRPQAHQQLVSQNVQNNITPGGIGSFTGRNTSLPSVSGITQSTMSNVVGLNSNVQNMRSISQASAQSGQVNEGDCQEEAYQKLLQIREKYLPKLTELLQKAATKLQELDSQQPKSDMLVQMERIKRTLEHVILVLQMPMSPDLRKEKLVSYEKQIQSFLSGGRLGKSMQQGLAQPKEPLPSPNEPTLGCPICLGPLVKETTTRCGHIFCEKCINAALAKQSRCPTCWIPVAAGDLIRVFLSTNTAVGEFWGVP